MPVWDKIKKWIVDEFYVMDAKGNKTRNDRYR